MGKAAIVTADPIAYWTDTGYASPRARLRTGLAQIITPESTVDILRHGYSVQIDTAAFHS